MTLKKYDKIPVHVIEDHNEALELIYRGIGSRHLPISGNSIVHFDSHPDLMVPKDMPASKVWNKYELFESLSIENWLIPSFYAGHFDSIYWIKPDWSEQIPSGNYKILIGKFDEFIRIYSSLYYFVSDGICVPEKRLENVREFSLTVSTMAEFDSIKKTDDINRNYVLDVDLDFFSTKNPFAEIFRKGNLYEKLKKLFSFRMPENVALNVVEESKEEIDNEKLICETSKKREEQLNELNRIFKCLERENGIESIEKELSETTLTELREILNCVKEFYPDVDWWTVHCAGLTCDETELPHHVSTENELSDSFEKFEKFLRQIRIRPVMITMARSTTDDYCPSEQVDFIQRNVLDIFAKVFGEISVSHNYETETR